jgi:hypothetical protein
MLTKWNWLSCFLIFVALERGDFSAAKIALYNGAGVNKAGRGGALLYSKMKTCFLNCFSKMNF